jgi:CRP-like cAMP-binding protein
MWCQRIAGAAGVRVHVGSKRPSGIAFASRGRLDGLRFGLRLDSRRQAAASHRTSTRRLLICRLYLGLSRTITDDYGVEFATHSDSLAFRTIGIYVFLRTVMCSPVRASQIAHALKLAPVSIVRRLEEMIKHGYVERVGNAYRITDKR